MPPLRTTLKKAIKQAVNRAGKEAVAHGDLKSTVKGAVKAAVKEAVKEMVEEAGSLRYARGLRFMHPDRLLRALILVVSAVLSGISYSRRSSTESGAGARSLTFGEFTQRVKQYSNCRTRPRMRSTKSRKQIVDRRHALALAIREARAGAKQGDIFTPEISEEFVGG